MTKAELLEEAIVSATETSVASYLLSACVLLAYFPAY